MAREYTIPVGKTLYHGSTRVLRPDFKFPKGDNGVWFAEDPLQSILHVSVRAGDTEPLYLYKYKTKRPVNVIRFDSSMNMNTWANSTGFTFPRGKPLAFSNKDFNLAGFMCKAGMYEGWSFPNDQTQVMLCRPQECLKFINVKEIIFPSVKVPSSHFAFSINNSKNKAMFEVVKNTPESRFRLERRRLNNLKTYRNYPIPKNAIYLATDRKNISGKILYFNSNGKQLMNLNKNKIKSKNGFNLHGKRVYSSGRNFLIDLEYKGPLINRIRKESNINLKPKHRWNIIKIDLNSPH